MSPHSKFFSLPGKQELDALFSPKSIAVIGATETTGSVGRTVMNNLKTSFRGTLYPINPKRSSVLEVPAYPSIHDVKAHIDLAVIVTPAKSVPGIIADCAALKIPSAIVISAGFKEMGPPGIELEEQILAHAKSSGMRVVGPNCLGVMRPSSGLNATFAAGEALKGNIAFISQSGALCTAVLDWSLREKVGFSAFVSIGSMLDVNWSDLIDYFGNDSETDSILIYLESIGDARSFLSAARQVAPHKPIFLIKAGRTEESAQAAASHTGALSGSDAVLSAALDRIGIARLDTIAELYYAADCLAKQPMPKGINLAIVTNAGGPGVIATDALIENGGKLASLSEKTIKALNAFLPPQWSRNNPIDLLGDAKAVAYEQAIAIALEDENTDATLVILTPQDMTEPTETAKRLNKLSESQKPLYASWMGAGLIEEGKQALIKAGIPVFPYPDAACRAFGMLCLYREHLQTIYAPYDHTRASVLAEPNKSLADQIIQKATQEGRDLLDEYESKKILEAYGIPAVPTEMAYSPEEASSLAERFGYPVVVKLFSRTITHKTDVGGVRLHLNDKTSVEKAFSEIKSSVTKLKGAEHFQGVTVQPMIQLDGYELILGSSMDEEFGPVCLFGSGGQLVEVFKDSALAIRPLTRNLAAFTMKKTKIYNALLGVRGKQGVDIGLLEEILIRFSQLIVEQPLICELDINPLLASTEQMIALDARVILQSKEKSIQSAMRAYPCKYTEQSTTLSIRALKSDDEPALKKFLPHLAIPEESSGWIESLKNSKQLPFLLDIDYDRELPLIVESKGELLALGRLLKIPLRKQTFLEIYYRSNEESVACQLLEKLLCIAEQEGLDELLAHHPKEDRAIYSFFLKLGFKEMESGLFYKKKR